LFGLTLSLSSHVAAASTVDVYCDGVDDQEKILNLLADDLTINLHNNCVFTGELLLYQNSDIVLQGSGNTILVDYIEDLGQSILQYGGSLTINDVLMIASPSFTNEAILVFDDADLTLNNVIIDGFETGIVVYSLGVNSSSLTATGLVIKNTTGATGSTGFADAAISSLGVNDRINWISGWSNANTAIELGSDIGIYDFESKQFIINNLELSGADIIMLDELNDMLLPGASGSNVILFAHTSQTINSLVNCGFPVGSEWDTCSELPSATSIVNLHLSGYLSLDCTSQVDLFLPSGYGETERDMTCNVLTNNANGYTIEVVSSADLDNNGSVIPNLGSASTSPAALTQTGTNARWAITTDAASNHFANPVWFSEGQISSSNTASASSGDDYIYRVGASVGPNSILIPGTYTGTLTFTASTID
jgi:hypothetical protein